MDPLYLRKLRIDRQLENQQLKNLKSQVENTQNTTNQKTSNIQNTSTENVNQNQPQKELTNLNSQTERLMKDMRDEILTPKQMKMNYLASMERSNYVKKMMNLPRTLPELLIQLQNPNLAKGLHNIMQNNIPEPDTQRTQTNKNDKTNPDGKNKNANTNAQENEFNSNEFEGFNDVLQKESDRKQAILEKYNVQQKTTNNVLKGGITNNNDNNTIKNNDTVVNNPNQNIDEDFSQDAEPPKNNLINNRPKYDGNKPTIDNRPNNPNDRPPIDNRPNSPNDRPPIDIRPNRPDDRPPIDIRPNRPNDRPPIDNKPMPDINNRPFMPDNRLPNDLRPFPNDRRPPIHEHRHRHELPPEETVSTETSQETEAAANLYANLSMNDVNNPTITQMRQRLTDDAFELLFTGLINLNDLSDTIKHNGKDARSKLILAMANASRQGIDNSQLASSMQMVSESMAAEENNPASILKNIIMLYLPWYPLQEGVGFNLAIETMPNSSDFSSLLKVFIQTRNYGNVNGSLILMSGNTVDMNIQCDDKFPKTDLLDRMKEVTQNHSIQSNITVEQKAQMYNEMANQQAKVNLSSTYELNPFLLLMAHSFIKNTIIIDSSANA